MARDSKSGAMMIQFETRVRGVLRNGWPAEWPGRNLPRMGLPQTAGQKPAMCHEQRHQDGEDSNPQNPEFQADCLGLFRDTSQTGATPVVQGRSLRPPTACAEMETRAYGSISIAAGMKAAGGFPSERLSSPQVRHSVGFLRRVAPRILLPHSHRLFPLR